MGVSARRAPRSQRGPEETGGSREQREGQGTASKRRKKEEIQYNSMNLLIPSGKKDYLFWDFFASRKEALGLLGFCSGKGGRRRRGVYP